MLLDKRSSSQYRPMKLYARLLALERVRPIYGPLFFKCWTELYAVLESMLKKKGKKKDRADLMSFCAY